MFSVKVQFKLFAFFLSLSSWPKVNGFTVYTFIYNSITLTAKNNLEKFYMLSFSCESSLHFYIIYELVCEIFMEVLLKKDKALY